MAQLSRRKFLQLLLAMSAATAITKRKTRAQTADVDVIVIGAGAAGLAAAQRIHNEGGEVIVLEARNRIGGRVYTDRSLDGVPLDLGASWIHGVNGNPVTEIAEANQIKLSSKTDYDNQIIYSAIGERLDGDAIEANFETFIEQVIELVEEDELEDNASLQDAINQVLARTTMMPEQVQQLNFAINAVIEHELAADASQLAAYHVDEGADDFGGGDVIFPDGYDQIINVLASGLDIRLNQVVASIEYDETGVDVYTADGEFFTAYYAIVTVPLGVLKQGTIQFDPPLPDRKRQAINRLGMGVLNKLYVRFPSVFWDASADLIGHVSEEKGQWAEWLNIAKYTNQPILLGFNAGVYGEALESKSDEAIVEEAMGVLRTIYGDSIPAPLDWIVTRWRQDQFAGGSYSYYAAGSSPDDVEALAEPVEDVLFFAGEATSYDYQATVHGAILSGRTAAQLIIDEEW